ncbi:Cell division protein BolA [hydrothermal vent metagenome]|uniref:Cell division protein BolA n=1 Tax=hydrothermal vent metagenome TaxID=652676 RepID=A0A3B0W009_9ZZZZ
MDLQSQIEKRVEGCFSVSYFTLKNESHLHSRGEPESHFKMILVSNDFEGVSKVKRHQSVYKALLDIMLALHALALHLYTEQEWREQSNIPVSPLCGGGR